jgi:hypothetical protein
MSRPNFLDSALVKPGGTVDLRTTAHSAFPMAAKTDSTIEVFTEPSFDSGVGTQMNSISHCFAKSLTESVVDNEGSVSNVST